MGATRATQVRAGCLSSKTKSQGGYFCFCCEWLVLGPDLDILNLCLCSRQPRKFAMLSFLPLCRWGNRASERGEAFLGSHGC